MSKKVTTETELMNVQRMQTYFIDLRNQSWGDSIEELEEMLPCTFHLNNKQTIAMEYMSHSGQEFLDIDLAGIEALGANYMNKYLYKEHHKIIPYLIEFYSKLNSNDIFAFFQRVFCPATNNFEWLYTSTKYYTRKDCLISISTPIKEMETIGNKMSKILDENTFMKKNFHRYMSLTTREREIIVLLAQGNTCSQIGNQLFIATQTIEKHRKNIYKKLEINNILELLKYAQAFDLV